MSHIVSIKTRLHDPVAISAACHRLGLAEPVQGTATMYAGQTVEGLLVQLPGWRFPIAIDTASGEIKADNFSGYWEIRPSWIGSYKSMRSKSAGSRHASRVASSPSSSSRMARSGCKSRKERDHMSIPRRRILRPPAQQPSPNNHVRLQKLRARLERERAALLRWQVRLKRAFNAFQKTQARITRLERQIAQLSA